MKSVAQEQKNEIMSQLQTIRYLMKKRGMDCPPLSVNGAFEDLCEGFWIISVVLMLITFKQHTCVAAVAHNFESRRRG